MFGWTYLKVKDLVEELEDLDNLLVVTHGGLIGKVMEDKKRLFVSEKFIICIYRHES